MKLTISKMLQWEFGALGIADPKSSPLRRYFELIAETSNVPGDVLELGVAQGSSLITSALMLEEANDARMVIGVDTFSGFPDTSPEDEFIVFSDLYSSGQISYDHFLAVQRNAELIKARGDRISVRGISSSGDFSKTSKKMVQEKVDAVGLSNRVEIHEGHIEKLLHKGILDRKWSLVLFDTDLYSSYSVGLPLVYERLASGGWIYLDEYFSLKFPGPRLAVNQFLEHLESGELVRLKSHNDFERWAITKK